MKITRRQLRWLIREHVGLNEGAGKYTNGHDWVRGGIKKAMDALKIAESNRPALEKFLAEISVMETAEPFYENGKLVWKHASVPFQIDKHPKGKGAINQIRDVKDSKPKFTTWKGIKTYWGHLNKLRDKTNTAGKTYQGTAVGQNSWQKQTDDEIRKNVNLSAIAAALILMDINYREAGNKSSPEDFSSLDTITKRAEFWKEYYNSSAGAGTVEKYEAKINCFRDDEDTTLPKSCDNNGYIKKYARGQIKYCKDNK